MATSSKVMFSLSVLRQKALESIDFRINQKQLELEGFDDDAALGFRVTEWRARQEERLSELFRQLGKGGIENQELALFRLDSMPEVDMWDRDKTMRELRRLESVRSQTIAKSESLVGDADGNISLTKIQLREFFGL